MFGLYCDRGISDWFELLYKVSYKPPMWRILCNYKYLTYLSMYCLVLNDTQ